MNCTTSGRFASSWLNILSIMVFMLMPTLWGGCAITTTLDGKRLQGFGTDGTSVLGGVSYILSREDIEKGMRRGDTQVPPMYQELMRNGLSDQELIDGKVVIIIYQVYRHNISKMHSVFDWAIVEKGIKAKEGNVVELRLRKPYAIIAGILYDDLRNSECKWILGDRGGFSALDAVNPGGGPGTSNLYCPTLEQAGWQKTPFGMYAGGFLMTKPPKN